MVVFGTGVAAALASMFFAYLRSTVMLSARAGSPSLPIGWCLAVLAAAVSAVCFVGGLRMVGTAVAPSLVLSLATISQKPVKGEQGPQGLKGEKGEPGSKAEKGEPGPKVKRVNLVQRANRVNEASRVSQDLQDHRTGRSLVLATHPNRHMGHKVFLRRVEVMEPSRGLERADWRPPIVKRVRCAPTELRFGITRQSCLGKAGHNNYCGSVGTLNLLGSSTKFLLMRSRAKRDGGNHV
jgi:hypothetical protein